MEKIKDMTDWEKEYQERERVRKQVASKYLLGNNAINAMLFAGVFFAIAAFLAMRLNEKKATNAA